MLKNLLEISAQIQATCNKANNFTKTQFASSYYDLVLKCGREFFSKQNLPLDIAMGVPKQCYFNCLEIIETTEEYNYCEGYIVNKEFPIPVIHAWLSNQEGDFIELTLKDELAHNNFYYGIEFNSEWVLDFHNEVRQDLGNISLIEGNYKEDFSFLREGFPQGALIKRS